MVVNSFVPVLACDLVKVEAGSNCDPAMVFGLMVDRADLVIVGPIWPIAPLSAVAIAVCVPAPGRAAIGGRRGMVAPTRPIFNRNRPIGDGTIMVITSIGTTIGTTIGITTTSTITTTTGITEAGAAIGRTIGTCLQLLASVRGALPPRRVCGGLARSITTRTTRRR